MSFRDFDDVGKERGERRGGTERRERIFLASSFCCASV